eukprot:CAMPEP_0194115810 /NCGR_PEP_ID=MMETSP0150-20130528/24672_1 /TAXON_ID=122233 /ORGANISM="Chaetoceros debilis, Strain MM31A-1" /LENGTH=474 /DNA_ID=CAMNT_0038806377 /DNA_START=474 /DNA_END=1898 /DNA_ORIENTATION=+
MNMNRSRSTASTFSTFLNPFKRKLGLKKSGRGTNALFRAISAENWELVISVCDSKPYKAEKWHNAVGFFDAHRNSKILPLHQACIFHPTQLAVRHIIQAYPNALQSTESGYGRVPLHIACHSNASYDCIHELAVNYPAASCERDVIGRVPLHYALSNGASVEIVEELLKAAHEFVGPNGHGKRQVCSVADFNGWLPLHVACFMGASAKVLSMLVKACPGAVESITKKNSTAMSLLKGISLSPQKKKVLEAILLRPSENASNNNESKPSVKYAARISPARTDIDKVVRMSDETCSKGVTLEIDEDETSSLSSMEGTLATVRTGSKRTLTTLTANRQLQFGGDKTRLSPPPDAAMKMNNNGGNGYKYAQAAGASGMMPSRLPTHDAYGNGDGVPALSYVPLSLQRGSTDPTHPSNNHSHSESGPDVSARRNTMTRLKSISSVASRSASRTSSQSGPAGEQEPDPVFQQITDTAVFC